MVIISYLVIFGNPSIPREQWSTYFSYRITETNGRRLMLETPKTVTINGRPMTFSNHNHLRDCGE